MSDLSLSIAAACSSGEALKINNPNRARAQWRALTSRREGYMAIRRDWIRLAYFARAAVMAPGYILLASRDRADRRAFAKFSRRREREQRRERAGVRGARSRESAKGDCDIIRVSVGKVNSGGRVSRLLPRAGRARFVSAFESKLGETHKAAVPNAKGNLIERFVKGEKRG